MQDPTKYQLFQEAFHSYYEQLCRYAFALTKEYDSSEDIVQEVFLRVWEKKQELIGTKELNFYVFGAVRNNCLSFLEKKRKNMVSELKGQEVADAPMERDPEKESGKDYNTLLQEALQQLPPKCREVFVLSRISDLTYQQISETLDISVKTVENHMGKALRILRTFIRGKNVSIIPLTLFFLYGVG
ncbi:MAG: RNA polymerase sigma-70 factor [Niastella sp.]|nr:RNA polymerase sigma-70 factor [Niastella sp.]